MKSILIPFLSITLFVGINANDLFSQSTANKFFGTNGLLQEESFEGESFPPEGWTKITDFDGTGWQSGRVDSTVLGMKSFGTIETPPSGGDFVAYASWATGDADGDQTTTQATDQVLVTPQITGIEVGDSLVFYLKYLAVFYDRLDVVVSVTDNDSLAFFDSTLAVLVFTNGSSNDWVQHKFDLSGFAGQDIYIGFREHVGSIFNQGDAFLLDLVAVNSLITSVAGRSPQPDDFQLQQNYPNPFNPSTQISFNLKESSNVTLKVYNLIGQEVSTILFDAFKPAGSHTVQFNASHLPNGIYYYKIEAGSFVDVKKMTLLK